jgi:hypothetical protein
MDQINQYSTRITLNYKVAYFITVIVFCIWVAFAVYVLFVPIIILWQKMFYELITILCFPYIFDILKDIFKTRITVSEKGLLLEKPFYKLFCKWEDIEKYNISYDRFELFCNKNADLKAQWIERIFFRSGYKIPLHLFVRKWGRYSDWNSDKTLILINKYRPEILYAICNS